MWIKLICPRSTRRPMDSAWKTRMAPPLALLVLGALTPPGHRVTLADENVEALTTEDAPDLVGITVKVDTAPRAFALATAYRARGVTVVLGGIHVTACPEACAPYADALVLGEAEELWPRLLADATAGCLRPRYEQSGAADPARVPVPRWELLPARHYLFTNTLTIGRGCPWRCAFCYNSSPRLAAHYRHKPLAHVLREVDSLGIDHVMFIDDNFIGDPAFVRTLLPELRARRLTWHAAVSADVGVHPSLLDEMAAAGCRSLFIGFETLNERALQACRKTQNRVAQYDATVDAIHARGIMVNASLVFGFDEDDADTFPATLTWLVRNRIATMTAHLLTPYPGTPFHDALRRSGRILDENLEHYNTAHVVFRPARMTPAELEHGYRWMYEQFYSWPMVVRRWPVAPGQATAYLLFNLAYRKYGTLTSRLGKWVGMRPLADLARLVAYPSWRRPRAAVDRATPVLSVRGDAP